MDDGARRREQPMSWSVWEACSIGICPSGCNLPYAIEPIRQKARHAVLKRLFAYAEWRL